MQLSDPQIIRLIEETFNDGIERALIKLTDVVDGETRVKVVTGVGGSDTIPLGFLINQNVTRNTVSIDLIFHTHPPTTVIEAKKRGYPEEILKKLDYLNSFPSDSDYVAAGSLADFYVNYDLGIFAVGTKEYLTGKIYFTYFPLRTVLNKQDLLMRVSLEEQEAHDAFARGEVTLEEVLQVDFRDVEFFNRLTGTKRVGLEEVTVIV